MHRTGAVRPQPAPSERVRVMGKHLVKLHHVPAIYRVQTVEKTAKEVRGRAGRKRLKREQKATIFFQSSQLSLQVHHIH